MKKGFIFMMLAGIVMLAACSTSSPSGEPQKGSSSSSGGKNGKAPVVKYHDSKCYSNWISIEYKVESDSKLTSQQVHYGDDKRCLHSESVRSEGRYYKAVITGLQHSKSYFFKGVFANEYGVGESELKVLTTDD